MASKLRRLNQLRLKFWPKLWWYRLLIEIFWSEFLKSKIIVATKLLKSCLDLIKSFKKRSKMVDNDGIKSKKSIYINFVNQFRLFWSFNLLWLTLKSTISIFKTSFSFNQKEIDMIPYNTILLSDLESD